MESFDEEERRRNAYREGEARVAVILLIGLPAVLLGWMVLAAILETLLGAWWWAGLIALGVAGLFVWGWMERRGMC